MKDVAVAEATILPAIPIETQPAHPRGAEILVRGLIKNGVDTVFGLPGGAVLHIYDAIWRFRDEITHYLVRHEQGAVHAAEGYARQQARSASHLSRPAPERPTP